MDPNLDLHSFCFRGFIFVLSYWGPSTKDVRKFFPIFDPYPPHVCNRLHFKDPSLKRTSANWKFDPPPTYTLCVEWDFMRTLFEKRRKLGTIKLKIEGEMEPFYKIYFCLRSTIMGRHFESLIGNVSWLFQKICRRLHSWDPSPLMSANVCNWVPPPPLKAADVLCGWPLTVNWSNLPFFLQVQSNCIFFQVVTCKYCSA